MLINTRTPEENDRHFVDNILKCIFPTEKNHWRLNIMTTASSNENQFTDAYMRQPALNTIGLNNTLDLITTLCPWNTVAPFTTDQSL